MDQQPHETDSHLIGADSILAAEFQYIAQSAFQANEDRARVSQLYFVTFGTFIAALISIEFTSLDSQQLYRAFTLIFLFNFLLAALTVAQLARLRAAWLESVRAMNQIKAELVQQQPHLAAYFRWTNANMPPPVKPNSVGFFLALMVALLGALALGSGSVFWLLSMAPGATVNWPIGIVIGLLAGLGLMVLYQQLLRRA